MKVTIFLFCISLALPLRSQESVDSVKELTIFLAPNGCPRCEIGIPNIFKISKQINPKILTKLIVDVGNNEDFLDFLSKNGGQSHFGCDMIEVDTIKRYESLLLRFKSQPVIRIISKSRKVLFERSMLGMFINSDPNSELVRALRGNKVSSNYSLRRLSKCKLETSPSNTLGECVAIEAFPNHEAFILQDYLSLRLKQYNYKTGKLEFIYDPPFNARKFFSQNLSDSEFGEFERNGTAKTMLLSSALSITGDTVISDVSLPNIQEIVKNDDTNIEVRAENPVILFKSDGTFMRILKTPLPDGRVICAFTGTNYDSYRHRYFVPVFKTPSVTSGHLYADEDYSLDSFYSFAPLVAIFDTNGNFVKYEGRLDTVYQSLKIGYQFANIFPIHTAKGSYIFQGLSQSLWDCQLHKSIPLLPPCVSCNYDSLSKPEGFQWTRTEELQFKHVFSCRLWWGNVDTDGVIHLVWFESSDTAAEQQWHPIVQDIKIIGEGVQVLRTESVPVFKDEIVRGVIIKNNGNEIVVLKKLSTGYFVEDYELTKETLD